MKRGQDPLLVKVPSKQRPGISRNVLQQMINTTACLTSTDFDGDLPFQLGDIDRSLARAGMRPSVLVTYVLMVGELSELHESCP